jgi:bidirectional [NiFe] hydrogenase diaphorase subunit
MCRHGRQSHILIDSLHTVQGSFGYLDLEVLRYVAAALRVPLNQIYGVAAFYHLFNPKPQGEHTCVVRLGTACYIKGAANIVAAIGQAEHVKAGETTAGGQLSLLSARCLGSCGLAPTGKDRAGEL